jgi:hypothetical protein
VTAPTRRARQTLQPQPESAVLRDCLAFLSLMRIYAWRQNTGAGDMGADGRKRFVRFGFSGVSDIIGIMPDGRFLAVECKRVGGTVSQAQQAFLDEVERRGGVAVVAYCVDDLDAAIKLYAFGAKS